MEHGYEEMDKGAEGDSCEAQMGANSYAKAQEHLGALKALLAEKGVSLEEFLAESDKGESESESPQEDAQEPSEEGEDKPNKLAIILALKKKQGMS